MAKKKVTTRKKAAARTSIPKKTVRKKSPSKTAKRSGTASTVKTSKKKTSKKSAAQPKASTKKTTQKKTTKKKTGGRLIQKKLAKRTKRPRSASAGTVVETVALEAASPSKPIRTHLSRKELNEFRNMLIIRRAEILGDVESMSEEALKINDSSNLSNMPLHMADVGSDNYEQELMLGLVESERAIITEINEAIGRIADRTYGVCLHTGKPIPKARLSVKPWAKYSVEAARELERNGQF